MSEQQADTSDLRQLAQTMNELVNYCSALKEGASGFAYMLPTEWQGPAMQAFLGSFAAWAAGAAALQDVAESLHDQVQLSFDAYSQTIEDLDSSWTEIEANLG
ncbi:WXG100 family type VII secretion target [Agromyces larvae]|uniref:WXG100 family type VII secretion target n=1 Tax=Agromyces larvae TaxID=2929802 RepID=A0ABY4BTW1_9MICO|nr:WXG100 family type VII secretion target [Agromyces larvae]UOE42648.1 hypothetical protein MTO99_10620 [Agromyces larvae]